MLTLSFHFPTPESAAAWAAPLLRIAEALADDPAEGCSDRELLNSEQFCAPNTAPPALSIEGLPTKPKRHRRTKAQIAADDAKAAAAAAHAATSAQAPTQAPTQAPAPSVPAVAPAPAPSVPAAAPAAPAQMTAAQEQALREAVLGVSKTKGLAAVQGVLSEFKLTRLIDAPPEQVPALIAAFDRVRLS